MNEPISVTRERIEATGLWPWEREGRPLTECDQRPVPRSPLVSDAGKEAILANALRTVEINRSRKSG